ncbi:CDP-glycerol glycerophosphotransferase family protein [Sphaerochaeta sp. PS]|uniref:CDP-glycerol glycerophosphotransferase family protein n=1 Tax=Sphaerochaeta sp. PS TaxID=3076336 RepID=UPI0028A4E500|nr:CDP-glycerol glycerophosphotransferase family protein [Sphaerochaeta sp. PS]MDT4762165.1 CDP-glycerol glycerophosphotransferase family protein [Sphaerochaeta sp. PS]
MMLFYIDPGTGSMLFSIVIGLVTMLYFVAKAAIIKLKFVLSGGKAVANGNRYPFVIYSEGERYWNVFKPIAEEFERRQVPVVFYTSSEKDPVFSGQYTYIKPEFIGEGNKAFTRLNFLEADVCLMTTPGLDVYQLKRSRGVKHYSHILHAVDDATSYRLFGLDYFDSVLLSGEYQKAHVRLLEEKRGIEAKDLEVVGCPYLDELQKKVASLDEAKDCPFTVLVAPSWGPSGILTRYGAKLLDPLVETGFTVIVRPHPQSSQSEKEMLERLKQRYVQKPSLEWDFNRENLGSLSRADIMISDFSGVIFDYTFLFDRPFLYVRSDFDAMPYDSYDVEEEPWKFRVLGEIGIELKPESFPTIKEVLLGACGNELLTENRKKAKETAWQYQGKSGERAVDYLVKKQKELS